jgi:cell division protein FtsL
MTAMAYMVIGKWIPGGDWVLAGIGILIFLCALGVVILAYQTWRTKLKAKG